MPDSTTVDLINGLPCWQGRIEISPLAGGMTNRNFLVADANVGRFVVRIGRDLPEHGVMRFHELAAARAAHRIGISPEVVFAMDGLMVSRFIDGQPLAVEDIRNPQYFEAILDLLAANLLDDGQRLCLIDWDYAGFISPLFDLANVSSNNGFDATRDDQLLARYCGARTPRIAVSTCCGSIRRGNSSRVAVIAERVARCVRLSDVIE